MLSQLMLSIDNFTLQVGLYRQRNGMKSGVLANTMKYWLLLVELTTLCEALIIKK